MKIEVSTTYASVPRWRHYATVKVINVLDEDRASNTGLLYDSFNGFNRIVCFVFDGDDLDVVFQLSAVETTHHGVAVTSAVQVDVLPQQPDHDALHILQL